MDTLPKKTILQLCKKKMEDLNFFHCPFHIEAYYNPRNIYSFWGVLNVNPDNEE